MFFKGGKCKIVKTLCRRATNEQGQNLKLTFTLEGLIRGLILNISYLLFSLNTLYTVKWCNFDRKVDFKINCTNIQCIARIILKQITLDSFNCLLKGAVYLRIIPVTR